MGIITVMDDTLSNKIAAGEVVERPASIVKELVENSIDAGSTVIEISLEEAGLTSIRVTDNGKGMEEDDALIAFSRHATSKIDTEHDLFRIRTLGFRGEALASIASVSKVSMWTSDGETTGTEVKIEGGKLVEHKKAAFRRGTDITVSQLFYNTPARLKYMKTIQTELGHSIDLINRLALSHPSIAFKLSHHNQVLLKTSGNGDIRRVIADVYGMDTARKMISFKGETLDYSVSGYVSLPELTRASKNYMTLIVNGRWVKNFVISNAIIEAYATYLPIGRFPIAVVNIESDPYLTDVNVHPAKQQIRMSKEPDVVRLITQSIRDALRSNMQPPVVAVKKPKPSYKSEQISIWDATKTAPVSSPIASTQTVEPVQEERSVPVPAEEGWTIRETTIPDSLQPTIPVQSQTTGPAFESDPFEDVSPAKSEKQFPQLEVVGQVHGTYIVAQNEDGFYLIDQHAAQERIKYEYFRDKLKSPNHGETQMLLMPLVLDYSLSDKQKIDENLHVLEQVGVKLEPFGPSSYVVKEYPAWFPSGEQTALIEELIEQVVATRQVDIGKLREDAAILMSCKRSIKANHYLTKADMERLLHDLSIAESPYTCPHGRPVLVHFTTYEIEKMFKRIM